MSDLQVKHDHLLDESQEESAAAAAGEQLHVQTAVEEEDEGGQLFIYLSIHFVFILVESF